MGPTAYGENYPDAGETHRKWAKPISGGRNPGEPPGARGKPQKWPYKDPKCHTPPQRTGPDPGTGGHKRAHGEQPQHCLASRNSPHPKTHRSVTNTNAQATNRAQENSRATSSTPWGTQRPSQGTRDGRPKQ
jgi:hypothetical protein